MKGIPEVLATRDDYQRLHALAMDGEVSKALVIDRWQGLIDTSRAYIFHKELAEGEAASGDEPQYRVMEEEGGRVEFLLAAAQNSRLAQLEWSEEEVLARITELKGA